MQGTVERQLKRYAAYFRGWCQAFGEHEHVHGDKSGIDWLLAGHQVGLVLPKEMIRPLHREVLMHAETPDLTITDDCICIGSLRIPLDPMAENAALDALESVLEGSEQVHLYLTSHLIYGGGNRIITFSTKKPVAIIYKEIGSMLIRLRHDPA